jgi:hypothetical protein
MAPVAVERAIDADATVISRQRRRELNAQLDYLQEVAIDR